MRRTRATRSAASTRSDLPPRRRCAIYTRKSTDEGLDEEFNSLQAQREACEAYVASQRHEGWVLVPTLFDDGGFSGGNVMRPGLQALLAEVDAGRIDVVVVYKVDRLTRSLPDFAKIVERFDAKGVSFVSVTQSFNTTTSMGRLTLNVLLSFAQFEREVGAERIRDKIAASKKKGLWMGGPVPLGYRVENRKLLVNEEEAQRVRKIFALYLKAGSISALLSVLRKQNIRTAKRNRANGSTTGDRFFGPGGLNHLLRNRTYLGELCHKGNWHQGEHPAILDVALFETVQKRLDAQFVQRRAHRALTPSLLVGRIYDSVGNRMTPSHSGKKGAEYRYYISRAFLEGQKERAGMPSRVSAPAVEDAVLQALLFKFEGIDPRTSDAVAEYLERVEVHPNQLLLTLHRDGNEELLPVPWAPRVTKPFCRIEAAGERDALRNENRIRLIQAVHKARGWFDSLASRAITDIDVIAEQEGRTSRSIRMLLNLAFLAPDIIEQIVSGRLSTNITVTDLARNLPLSWKEQRQCLGLPEAAL